MSSQDVPYPPSHEQPSVVKSVVNPPAYGNIYPPPGSYPPGLVQPAAVVGQPVVVQSMQFGPSPMLAYCNNCHSQVTTNIEYVNGAFSWIICSAMACFGLILCCWIPLVVDSCKDTSHKCPQCNIQLGSYLRL